LTVTVIVLFS